MSSTSSLIFLLCLDRANAELDLGLEFESVWGTELTSSNILYFFVNCFAAGDFQKCPTIPLHEVEELVIPAMRSVDSRKAQLPTGGARLHEIVRIALDSGHALDWVPVYRDDILRAFTSGPSEALLERCGRKDDTLQQNRPSANVGGLSEAEGEKVRRLRFYRCIGLYPSEKPDN